MRIPDGFEVEGEPLDGEDTKHWVVRLSKGLYGTKAGTTFEVPPSVDRLRLFGRGDVKIFLPIEPNGGEQTQHNTCHPPISWPPSKHSKHTDLDPPVPFTRQVAYHVSFAMAAWPLEKIEPECEMVVDDATSFPKSMCGSFSPSPLFRKGTHPGLVWLLAPYEGSPIRRRDHEKITRHLESECI